MPAVSKQQQQSAGMALAAKRGDIPVTQLKGSALSMYKSMSIEQLAEFAETKRKGLPERKGQGSSKKVASKKYKVLYRS